MSQKSVHETENEEKCFLHIARVVHPKHCVIRVNRSAVNTDNVRRCLLKGIQSPKESDHFIDSRITIVLWHAMLHLLAGQKKARHKI
jgi:hypothetical protein